MPNNITINDLHSGDKKLLILLFIRSGQYPAAYMIFKANSGYVVCEMEKIGLVEEVAHIMNFN